MSEPTRIARPLFTLAPGVELVLASASPRRQQFLADLGVPFTVRPVVGEPDALPGQETREFVLHCALFKLWAARQKRPDAREIVVAADTIVAVDGRILGKPANDAEALEMLRLLNGRDHQVLTAVAVDLADQNTITCCDVCNVHFHAWDEQTLRSYVATGECADKAGAYAIQGKGAFLVDRIDGSWSTVVGLPVSWLASTLVARGVLLPSA